MKNVVFCSKNLIYKPQNVSDNNIKRFTRLDFADGTVQYEYFFFPTDMLKCDFIEWGYRDRNSVKTLIRLMFKLVMTNTFYRCLICSISSADLLNSSHAVRDSGRVRQYPPWLLFAAFVESVGCPRYNPQKTRKQWRTRDRRFHWLWGWFPDLKIIFMM